MTSIGIDLGTTYSCVAFMKQGKAEVIANDQGHRITPSVVSFTDEERVVGEGAKQQMLKNPKNTVYDAKRLIGRKFADPAVQSDIRQWLFLVTNDGGKPKIQVKYKGDEKTLNPEEVSAAVLEKMKSIAQDYIGGEIHSAVITVPAYFGDAQRRVTKDAADIAGLYVLGMINEPTAAAIAYGLDRKTDSKSNVLIFDIGGGTFDVTVMTIQDNIYIVKACGGDSHLGGQDINDRLYNYFVADFVKKNKADLTERAKHRIRVECEQVKRMLSTTRKASSVLDHLHGEQDFNMEITRAKFEQLCDDLFRGTIETVEKVLEDAKMQKEEIDDVVLVGGSTRIPVLQEMLEEYFGEGKISKTINPDEAVACGAAIKAAFLSGDISAAMEGMKLEDVIPLSLGVETKGGIMTFVVEKNARIPTKKNKTIVTTVDNQESISYPVFEGERALTKLNTELGSFTLSGLPRLPAGLAKTEICFNIDENGVLNVTARDMSNQTNEAKLKITWDKGRFGEEELKRMYEEARKFRREDEINKQIVIARNDLETLAMRGQRIVRQAKQGTESQRCSLKKRCTDVLEWLEENPNAMLPKVKAKSEELKETVRLVEGIGGRGTV